MTRSIVALPSSAARPYSPLLAPWRRGSPIEARKRENGRIERTERMFAGSAPRLALTPGPAQARVRRGVSVIVAHCVCFLRVSALTCVAFLRYRALLDSVGLRWFRFFLLLLVAPHLCTIQPTNQPTLFSFSWYTPIFLTSETSVCRWYI